MRNALFVALTATLAGVLFSEWLKRRAGSSELSPDASASPGVASIKATGSGDQVQGADYWQAFGQEKVVYPSKAIADITLAEINGAPGINWTIQ